MNILLFLLVLGIFLISYKKINSKNLKNKKISKFKNKLLSKETNIEKIFLRDDERTSLNPSININIGLYENEENITRKSNIHRARLSKYKKSKLNGEMIYVDKGQKIFKYLEGVKIYL